MATLTIRRVPIELIRRLRVRAEQNHRSLNEEAILALERSFSTAGGPDEALLARIRENRQEMAADGVWVTPEFVERAIGRDTET